MFDILRNIAAGQVSNASSSPAPPEQVEQPVSPDIQVPVESPAGVVVQVNSQVSPSPLKEGWYGISACHWISTQDLRVSVCKGLNQNERQRDIVGYSYVKDRQNDSAMIKVMRNFSWE